MDLRRKKITFAETAEVEGREREVRLMKQEFPGWPEEFTARH
jgi:hypothetical protein